MQKSLLLLLLTMLFLTTGVVNKTDTSVTEDASLEIIEQVQSTALNVDDYMASVKEQSDSIKNFLEHDALTQADMNLKSQELYILWDHAMNDLLTELHLSLSEEDWAQLQAEQKTWLAEMEKTVQEAGKEFEGGSLYSLIVSGEAATLTEDRVYELYQLLKDSTAP